VSRTFFLYHRRSRPTGEILARALGAEHDDGSIHPPTRPGSPLIRWGSRAYAYFEPSYGRVLNPAAAIERASNKLESLTILRDRGIPVPELDTDPEALVERVGYPILGRRTQHARGTDIVLCLQRRDYRRRPRDYYVAYVPTNREYRLHVAGGEVIRVQGKYLDVSADYLPWLRNYSTGHRFRAPRRRLHNARLNDAVGAVEALGLDFGAVDLIVADNGAHYVLEVNTSPSCSPLTGAAYVTKFAEMLGISTEGLNYGALDLLNPESEERDSEDEVEGVEEPEYEDMEVLS
jgi:glutathione synthase/RimK-type ligase-like ATP-grasp enzyme